MGDIRRTPLSVCSHDFGNGYEFCSLCGGWPPDLEQLDAYLDAYVFRASKTVPIVNSKTLLRMEFVECQRKLSTTAFMVRDARKTYLNARVVVLRSYLNGTNPTPVVLRSLARYIVEDNRSYVNANSPFPASKKTLLSFNESLATDPLVSKSAQVSGIYKPIQALEALEGRERVGGPLSLSEREILRWLVAITDVTVDFATDTVGLILSLVRYELTKEGASIGFSTPPANTSKLESKGQEKAYYQEYPIDYMAPRPVLTEDMLRDMVSKEEEKRLLKDDALFAMSRRKEAEKRLSRKNTLTPKKAGAKELLRTFALTRDVKRPEVKVRPRQVPNVYRKELTLRLAQKVNLRFQAGGLVVIIQDPDEQLALDEAQQAAKIHAPVKVLSGVSETVMDELGELPTGRGTIILLDFLQIYGENPAAIRMIREVALQTRVSLPGQSNPFSRLVLIERPEVAIPAGLTGDCEIIVPELPSIDELGDELDSFIKGMKINLGEQGEATSKGAVFLEETRYKLASAVAGLARHEAARLFGRCWVETKTMEPAWLRKEKAKVVTLRLQGALTFEDAATTKVGGLANLKKWLAKRKGAFGSAAAKEYGLPEPKGLLLLGVPGGGKSLTARTIAGEWGQPLLRLDAGRLFGSLVGQSESQTRQAIKAAEACAPCVLWIDEIEKGLSGGSGGAGDSGTSSRVFGTILTWLQDKTSPVFVVATANKVSALPPELLRKGRFDEIFYVGLPCLSERAEIFRIHLSKRGRSFEDTALDSLAGSTDKFSGAEIEQAVVDGLFASFVEDRELSVADVEKAIKDTIPLAETMKEDIKKLDKWKVGRARSASEDLGLSASPSDTLVRPGIG